MVGDPVALRYQDKRGRWKVRQFWQGTRTAFGKVTRGYEENGKPMVDDVPVEADRNILRRQRQKFAIELDFFLLCGQRVRSSGSSARPSGHRARN